VEGGKKGKRVTTGKECNTITRTWESKRQSGKSCRPGSNAKKKKPDVKKKENHAHWNLRTREKPSLLHQNIDAATPKLLKKEGEAEKQGEFVANQREERSSQT